jgi:hypothetical protein
VYACPGSNPGFGTIRETEGWLGNGLTLCSFEGCLVNTCQKAVHLVNGPTGIRRIKGVISEIRFSSGPIAKGNIPWRHRDDLRHRRRNNSTYVRQTPPLLHIPCTAPGIGSGEEADSLLLLCTNPSFGCNLYWDLAPTSSSTNQEPSADLSIFRSPHSGSCRTHQRTTKRDTSWNP